MGYNGKGDKMDCMACTVGTDCELSKNDSGCKDCWVYTYCNECPKHNDSGDNTVCLDGMDCNG